MMMYYLIKIIFTNFTPREGWPAEVLGDWVSLSLSQAVLSYQLAASQGHRLAQYRYARCLLRGPASTWGPECQRAVSMLKQAAHSGLREVSARGGGRGSLLGSWGMRGLEVIEMPFSFFLNHRLKLSSGCFSPRSHTWTSGAL